MHWHCHELYHRMPSGAVAGGIAVVIDVLRASTTIVTALAHGAAAVAPRRSIEEALAAAADRPGAVLGGERGGVMIAGFDLGNSPLEYAPDRVAGRPVVITTTNGTAALAVCRDAAEVLVGAIVNRTAVAATAVKGIRACCPPLWRWVQRRIDGICHRVTPWRYSGTWPTASSAETG